MRRARLSTAAVLLGIGLGGLLDAILFERILQWQRHAVGGWFDFGLWLAALVGVVFLWSSLRAPGRAPSPRSFVGHALIGWGGLNLVDGLVFHGLLELQTYGWSMTVVAAAAFVIGLALRDAPEPEPVRFDRRTGIDRRLSSVLD
jgi:uncharacterized membrane protein